MISAQTRSAFVAREKPVPTHRVGARGHAFPDHALPCTTDGSLSPSTAELSRNSPSNGAREKDRTRCDQAHAGGVTEAAAERKQLLARDVDGDGGNPDKVHDTADEQ
jgi:hypothetical protein